jgi:autotransporter-associated beta strand protein
VALAADVVLLGASNQIPDTVVVGITSSGLLDLNGFNETIGSITLNGGQVATGAGTLTLADDVTTTAATAEASISGNLSLGDTTRTFTVANGAATRDLIISAVVSGAALAGLTKAGAGTMVLAGVNTYSFITTVDAGTLLIDGSLPSGNNLVQVNAGAFLGGDGTAGRVSSFGVTSALGRPAGPATATGGSLVLDSAAFIAHLAGTAPGIGYDQLAVTGSVFLNNAQLTPLRLFTSAVGDSFILLDNDGTDAVNGTFAGRTGASPSPSAPCNSPSPTWAATAMTWSSGTTTPQPPRDLLVTPAALTKANPSR